MSLIECQNISVSIGSSMLLEDITVSVTTGDYLAILGANGSGKSTLLRCLLGLQAITEGTIAIEGKPIQQYRRRILSRLISYVPQATGTQYNFSVENFVRMARYAYHSPLSAWQAEDQQALEHALQVTETESLKNRDMHTLSGGECQRVMIAAAVCQSTPIMILDEPTSHLDPHHQVAVHKLIQRLNTEHKMTIIEVSHDINHASQHAQRILALKQGRQLWSGNSDELMQADRLQQLYDQSFIMLTHPQTSRPIALPDEAL